MTKKRAVSQYYFTSSEGFAAKNLPFESRIKAAFMFYNTFFFTFCQSLFNFLRFLAFVPQAQILFCRLIGYYPVRSMVVFCKVQEWRAALTAVQCSDLVSVLPLNHTQMSATVSSMPLTLSTPLSHSAHMTTHQHRKQGMRVQRWIFQNSTLSFLVQIKHTANHIIITRPRSLIFFLILTI